MFLGCVYVYSSSTFVFLILNPISDGGWSNFTDLPCSATCGIGVLVSRRTCDNPPPQFGGADCVGSATKFAKCDAGSCVRGLIINIH